MTKRVDELVLAERREKKVSEMYNEEEIDRIIIKKGIQEKKVQNGEKKYYLMKHDNN